MKRVLVLVVLALVAVVAHPQSLRAQCNEACVKIDYPDAKGYGCVVQNDSGAACYARSFGCHVKLCSNAMVTDATGRMLAIADICGDEVTLRPVEHERTPARVAVQPPRAKRAASNAAKARAG
jgi:hypothetical protein